MSARRSRVGAARRSIRRRRRFCRSSVAGPAPACSRMSWSASIAITCRFTARPRSMVAKASISGGRPWPGGLGAPPGSCARWSRRSAATCWPPTRSMATTRRCGCWRREPARRRPAGCGQVRGGPLLAGLKSWLEATVARLSRKSELATAIRYALNRWIQLTRYRDDGRLEIDNNAAERAIRTVATARSLYPPSSSVCKHCKLVFGFDPTRATCSPDRGGYPFVLQIRGSDLVRSARHNLIGGEYAVVDQPSDAVVRDAEHRSGFGHRQPFAVLIGGK